MRIVVEVVSTVGLFGLIGLIFWSLGGATTRILSSKHKTDVDADSTYSNDYSLYANQSGKAARTRRWHH
jgi:hypothetical protein